MIFMIFLSRVSDLELWVYTLKTNRLSNLSTPRDPRCSKAFTFCQKKKRIHESLIYVSCCHQDLTKCQPFEILQLAPSVPVLLLELTAIKLYESIFEQKKHLESNTELPRPPGKHKMMILKNQKNHHFSRHHWRP